MSTQFTLATHALLEIDHIFVCLPVAIAPAQLFDLGLTCPERVLPHVDQGTASLSIFFENMYLELIWAEDVPEAQYSTQSPDVNFWARSQRPQASPFGIALRQTLDHAARPFDLLPTENTIDPVQTFVNFDASNVETATEPLCFVIPDAISLLSLLDRTSRVHQKLITHPAGLKRLTGTCLKMARSQSLSQPLSLLQHEGIVKFEPIEFEPVGFEQSHLSYLELTFDHQAQCKQLDLRWLNVPVVLNY
jgi:hypothetical protein